MADIKRTVQNSYRYSFKLKVAVMQTKWSYVSVIYCTKWYIRTSWRTSSMKSSEISWRKHLTKSCEQCSWFMSGRQGRVGDRHLLHPPHQMVSRVTGGTTGQGVQPKGGLMNINCFFFKLWSGMSGKMCLCTDFFLWYSNTKSFSRLIFDEIQYLQNCNCESTFLKVLVYNVF